MACRLSFRLFSHFPSGKNHYKTLGLPPSATAEEVKKAYHTLAKVHHPDSKTGNEAKFKDIAEAFEVLGDEKLRSQYDYERNAGGKQGEEWKQGQRQAQREGMYRGADPFSGFGAAKSPFEQASWEEKMRKAAESHEKWKRGSRRSPPVDFPPWGQRGNPYHHAPNPENSPNRPPEAWIYELLAFGILLTVGYWSIKTMYAILTLQQPVEMRTEPQPVFRPVQRREVEQEVGPFPRARVTRSRWQEGAPPQSP